MTNRKKKIEINKERKKHLENAILNIGKINKRLDNAYNYAVILEILNKK